MFLLLGVLNFLKNTCIRKFLLLGAIKGPAANPEELESHVSRKAIENNKQLGLAFYRA